MTREPSRFTHDPRPQFWGRQSGYFALQGLTLTQSPWYEDEDTIRRGLEWGRKKARMLRWVESQMVLQLTPVERRSIELYYFRGKNYREAAEILGMNPSSVHRAVRRGIRKLRKAAKKRPAFR